MTDPVEDNYLNIKALRFAKIERANQSKDAFNYVTFIQEQFWQWVIGPFDIFLKMNSGKCVCWYQILNYILLESVVMTFRVPYLFHTGELTVNDVADILKISKFFKIIKHFFSLVDQKEYKVRDVI